MKRRLAWWGGRQDETEIGMVVAGRMKRRLEWCGAVRMKRRLAWWGGQRDGAAVGMTE